MTSTTDNTPKLWSEHAEVLAKRGIPQDLALKYGLRSVSSGQIKGLRLSEGRGTYPGLPGYDTSGILIPYHQCEDKIPRCRIRADRTEYIANEEPIPGVHAAGDLVKVPRYIAQAGVGVVPYIATAFQFSETTERDIFVAEAPLKALSLRAHGFAAIGLGGVLAGAHDRDVLRDLGEITAHAELRRINWQGRRSYVVFDAGMTENPLVALGAARTAHVLRELGADVWMVTLPFLREDINLETGLMYTRTDQGPDDFLARNGIEVFNQLVEQAVPANPVARVRLAVGPLPRGDHDARVAAATRVATLLGELPFRAVLQVAGEAERAACAAITERLKIGPRAYNEAAREFDERIHRRMDEQVGDVTYFVKGGCIYLGDQRLTNFTATIQEETVRVGGADEARAFRIGGELAGGCTLPTVEVPASSFPGMEWITERWGARAIIEAGRSVGDHVRAAIQTLSSPTTRTIYTGYGWRGIDGKNVYLLRGPHVLTGVEIEHETSHYTLEGNGDPVQAYRAVLDLLQVAPFEVMVPLVGAAFIAPFSTPLELDFGLWMSGRSGTRKSSLAALILSFFGRFTLTNLPLNFQATPTYLEARLHEYKDMLTVVDNYIPPQTGRDAQDQTSKAVRLIQSIGDRASRGRCRRDASMQPRRDPQGLVLFTGERLPAENESTLGRLLFITLGEDTVNLAHLSDLQTRSGLLPMAMRHMIEHVSGRFDEVVAGLQARRTQLTVEFNKLLIGAHGRTPGVLASVMVGYETLLGIAREVGACSADESDSLRQRGFESLIKLGLGQPKAETLGPSDFYLRTLRAMVAQGIRVLVEEHEPLNTTKDIGDHTVEVKNGIGWRCGDQVCLLPALAWQAVVEFHRGTTPYTATDVHRGLAEHGLLLNRDEEGAGRFTARRPVGGGRERVLVLSRDLIEEPDDPGTPNLATVISMEEWLDGTGSV